MYHKKVFHSFHLLFTWIVNIRSTDGSCNIFHTTKTKWVLVLLIGWTGINVQAGIFESKKIEIVPVKETKASAAAKKKEINKAPVIAEERSFSSFTDKKPEFPGGSGAMKKFIAENLKAPYSEEDIYGRVTCQFIVNLDGSISNCETVISLGLCFDAEVIRIIRLFPNWTPGQKKGIPVRAYSSVEVYFRHQRHPNENKVTLSSVFKPIYKSKFITKISSFIKKPSRRLKRETAD